MEGKVIRPQTTAIIYSLPVKLIVIGTTLLLKCITVPCKTSPVMKRTQFCDYRVQYCIARRPQSV